MVYTFCDTSNAVEMMLTKPFMIAAGGASFKLLLQFCKGWDMAQWIDTEAYCVLQHI